MSVRLIEAVSDQDPGVNGVFEAVVDAPVTVDGTAVIPQGSTVAGRVESTRAASLPGNRREGRGYVRLTLDSIHVAGLDWPIQTSSLYARPDSEGTSRVRTVSATNVVRLEKGRRLTFRLSEPLSIAIQQASASH